MRFLSGSDNASSSATYMGEAEFKLGLNSWSLQSEQREPFF